MPKSIDNEQVKKYLSELIEAELSLEEARNNFKLQHVTKPVWKQNLLADTDNDILAMKDNIKNIKLELIKYGYDIR